jgi:hypothetical protein
MRWKHKKLINDSQDANCISVAQDKTQWSICDYGDELRNRMWTDGPDDKAVYISKTSVYFYETTRRYILEGCRLYISRRENLKTHRNECTAVCFFVNRSSVLPEFVNPRDLDIHWMSVNWKPQVSTKDLTRYTTRMIRQETVSWPSQPCQTSAKLSRDCLRPCSSQQCRFQGTAPLFVVISLQTAEGARDEDSVTIPNKQRLINTAYQLTSPYVSMHRHGQSYNEWAALPPLFVFDTDHLTSGSSPYWDAPWIWSSVSWV